MSERLDLPGVSYRLGRWQDVLADVDACDVVLTDPPYSERTHEGYRTGSGTYTDPGDQVGYVSLQDADEFASHWSTLCRLWTIQFGDHVSFRSWESAWQSVDWYTFPPVFWLRRNPGPRMAADGPASAGEHVLVARPRRRVRDPLSRPGRYDVATAPATGVIGTKDVGGLRRILEDYTRPGDLVVDPYAGTATVGQACIETGRRYIGSEVDPRTYALGVKRLRAATPCLPGMEPDKWREKPAPTQGVLL